MANKIVNVYVFDNGGSTFDRYTVFFEIQNAKDARKVFMYFMSHNADSPQGVCSLAQEHTGTIFSLLNKPSPFADENPVYLHTLQGDGIYRQIQSVAKDLAEGPCTVVDCANQAKWIKRAIHTEYPER